MPRLNRGIAFYRYVGPGKNVPELGGKNGTGRKTESDGTAELTDDTANGTAKTDGFDGNFSLRFYGRMTIEIRARPKQIQNRLAVGQMDGYLKSTTLNDKIHVWTRHVVKTLSRRDKTNKWTNRLMVNRADWRFDSDN